jgi:hypothetical protein
MPRYCNRLPYHDNNGYDDEDIDEYSDPDDLESPTHANKDDDMDSYDGETGNIFSSYVVVCVN